MTRYYNDILNPMDKVLREDIPNFTSFRQCEVCGVLYSKDWRDVRFYTRYNQILCDRCVDIKDGTWIWEVNDNE